MKRIKTFIIIFCTLLSCNVWSQDFAEFKLHSEDMEAIDKMGETELKVRLMFKRYVIEAIQARQNLNRAIGVTSDSKYIVLPYSIIFLFIGFHAERWGWILEDTLVRVFYTKESMDFQWFRAYDELVSQMIDESKKIFKLRREAGLKNQYYSLSSLPLGREIVRDVEGKQVDLVYKERIGKGLQGGKYQALLDAVEKDLNIPDRDKKIRILKSLVQKEEVLIGLKNQLSRHIKAHPKLKTSIRKRNLSRTVARTYGLAGSVLLLGVVGTALSEHAFILFDEHTDLSEMKEFLQAEVDYILYLLAQSE